MMEVTINLDHALAFIVIFIGCILAFMGTLPLREAIFHKVPMAFLPFFTFLLPGLLLILAGWRLIAQ